MNRSPTPLPLPHPSKLHFENEPQFFSATHIHSNPNQEWNEIRVKLDTNNGLLI